jgi:hypothetical protein
MVSLHPSEACQIWLMCWSGRFVWSAMREGSAGWGLKEGVEDGVVGELAGGFGAELWLGLFAGGVAGLVW